MITTKSSTNESIKKLGSNIVSLLVVQISNYALPLISIPFFTRIVGPEKFGIINFVGAFVGYCMLLTSFGFDTSATRDVVQVKDDPKLLNQLCSEVFYSKVLLLAISLVAYGVLVYFVPQMRQELFVSISSVLLCFSVVLIPSWLYQGFQDNHLLAYYNIASKIIFTIAILSMVKVKADYVLYPLFLSLSQIIIGCVAFYQIHHRYQIKIIRVTFDKIKERIKSSQAIFISFVIISLYSTSNILIIGFLEDEEAVGQLSAALKIMVLIQACISMPFSQALFPFIGQRFRVSKDEGLRVVQFTMPIVLTLAFIACLLGCLLAPVLVGIIFGKQFSEAINILRVLSFVPFVIVFSQFLGIHIMVNLNMDLIFKKVIFSGALIGIAMNFLGGYLGGTVGISFTYFLTELLIAFLFMYFLKKENITLSILFAKVNESFSGAVSYIKSIRNQENLLNDDNNF
ncbi:oligosaccharide flippase family protein [Pontibacter amylolyticus]|uniref:Transporter n=1 Tax=Pontibacter amylolyticus TaxID=1424080 RepID=A0ABQ1W3V6_9BACT|nr:oligosaccharide flippase family protein [Pontibacter amylolyticus]GGG12438.1 transporter [Pontibacter amylolyticus]